VVHKFKGQRGRRRRSTLLAHRRLQQARPGLLSWWLPWQHIEFSGLIYSINITARTGTCVPLAWRALQRWPCSMRSSMQTRTTEDGQEIHNLVKGLTFVHTSGTMLGIYLCCSAWSVYYSSRFADMLFFAAYLVFENCETLTLLTWSPPL